MLAVTRMHGGVCTAGIDEAGNWVRPVRPTQTRTWDYDFVTDHCLLPIDFFHGGQSHLVNLGVTRFYLDGPTPKPPHSEDWTIDLSQQPQLIRKLSAAEQVAFLAAHLDAGPPLTVPSANRSLGLVLPDSFSFSFMPNATGEDVAVRASFNACECRVSDAGCTDLRMRALGRKLLEKSRGERTELTDDDFRSRGKEITYVALGLSRLHKGRHWPIVVGVHSIPELEVEVDYTRL